MKKLGVIVCGQPRFIKYTWKFIKEQYTIPGYETKYFGHLWNGVGYSKNNDINDEYEPHEISDNIAKDFTKLKIDKYQNLDTSIIDFYSEAKNYIPKEKTVRAKRYHFGQVYSKQEAYNLLQEYEKQTNTVFDVIVVIKTDFIYKNNVKKQQLFDISEKDDLVKTISASIVEYNCNLDTLSRKNVFSYIKEYERAQHVIKNPKSFYRLRINSHWQLFGRKAAHFMLGEWYTTALQIAKESKKQPLMWKRINSMGTMYGEIILRNNLKVQKGNPRIFRVINKDNFFNQNCFERGVRKNTTFITCTFQDIKSEQESLQEQLYQK